MFFNSILIVSISMIFFTGCSFTKPSIKQNSTAYQQSEAKKAFVELDQENGEPKLSEPVIEKKIEKPSVSEETIKDKKSPLSNKNKKLNRITKFPFKDGRPVWFYDANYEGYFGAIGIARKSSTRGGYATQKRLAKTLAQAELAKQLKVFVHTELKLERKRILTKISDSYKSKLSTLSVHQSEEILKNAVILDEWKDPKNGDLYVWLVIKK